MSGESHGPAADPSSAGGRPLSIHELMRRLPHRYPFLLIDRVLECIPGKSVRAIKNVTINEPFFTGHFPQRPVMPGVLILEALAQATGVLAMASVDRPRSEHALYYLVGMDNVRFRQVVEPGDQLLLQAELLRAKRGIWMFDSVAMVDGREVASASIMCTARDIAP